MIFVWLLLMDFCILGGKQTEEIWSLVQKFQTSQATDNLIETNRAEQAKNWMWNEIRNGLVERLKTDPAVAKKAAELEVAVTENRLSPTSAADELMDMFIRD